MDRPICTGLRTPMHLRKVGRMIAPMMPVMTTAIAVMEVTPPSISATATAIGVVTDFGTRESVVLSLRPNQMAEEQHAADGYHRANERAEQDGQQVFQQYIQLAVNRDRKRYRCRRQEERDQLAGFLIGLVGGAGCNQQRADQNRGNQQRIADRRTGFL